MCRSFSYGNQGISINSANLPENNPNDFPQSGNGMMNSRFGIFQRVDFEKAKSTKLNIE